jgi:hypothetical protein
MTGSANSPTNIRRGSPPARDVIASIEDYLRVVTNANPMTIQD